MHFLLYIFFFISQDRGILHIAEALIEQANYFKVLHGGSTSTPSQPLSSKHTLTRSDKNETKYECLARLINATKPNADAASNTNSGNNFNILIAADKGDVTNTTKSIAVTTTINQEESKKPTEVDEKKVVQEVTKPIKSDNNNSNVDSVTKESTIKPQSPPIAAASAITTTAMATATETAPAASQEIEQNSKESIKSDIDDSSLVISSNTTTSLDSSDKNNTDTIAKDKHVEDNNNEAADVKCTKSETVLTNSEQSTETVEQKQQQKLITEPKADLSGTLDDVQPASTNCQLDINENKSDMKLNYAEMVKVENAIESTICENKSFIVDKDNSCDHVDNKNFVSSTRNVSSDLDEKVQNNTDATSVATPIVRNDVDITKKCGIGCSSPKPIQAANDHRHDDQDEEMSPVCKVRLPLNSPRLTKSKDIMGELPLTPDSSHSLDSSCEYATPFETIKQAYNTSIVPERSFSSESLNSETSIESNDSKSSIKLAEAKFSKNGTLERQNNSNIPISPTVTTPNGLQVLMLWNNHITRDSAQSISKLLAATTTLEILNVGKNVLSNDFVANIKASLKANTSLASLGLQSVHLSNEGVKILSEILDFGGNVTLQRVDLRDNNLQVSGLTSLNEVLKSNKSITRIDLDDVPRRAYVSCKRSFV